MGKPKENIPVVEQNCFCDKDDYTEEATEEGSLGEPTEVVTEEVLSFEEQKIQIDDSTKTSMFSMYESLSTTIFAIFAGITIISAIQYSIYRIFSTNKNSYRALTQFVTMMFGLVVGGYITNVLVASPGAQIISQEESIMIVSFIKDICLMVFAYYFGTQSKEEPSDSV